MPDFPIIDTHLHVWDTTRLRYAWLEEEPKINRPFLLNDYAEATKGIDIGGMVFLQCDADPAQYLDEARWVAELAKDDPRIRGMVPFAPVEKGAAVAEELEHLAQFDILRGIRRLIQAEPDPEFCLQPSFVEGVQTVGKFGLRFEVCIKYHQMASALELMKRCPDVPLILDHIGKPNIAGGEIEPWASQLYDMAKLPNVWCKLSGVATEADHQNWTREDLKPFLDTAIEAFGPDRIMFGGDWPVATLAIGYMEWVQTVEWALEGASKDDLRKVFRDNAKAFYQI
jgi:L-fuconolactonase